MCEGIQGSILENCGVKPLNYQLQVLRGLFPSAGNN